MYIAANTTIKCDGHLFLSFVTYMMICLDWHEQKSIRNRQFQWVQKPCHNSPYPLFSVSYSNMNGRISSRILLPFLSISKNCDIILSIIMNIVIHCLPET